MNAELGRFLYDAEVYYGELAELVHGRRGILCEIRLEHRYSHNPGTVNAQAGKIDYEGRKLDLKMICYAPAQCGWDRARVRSV